MPLGLVAIEPGGSKGVKADFCAPAHRLSSSVHQPVATGFEICTRNGSNSDVRDSDEHCGIVFTNISSFWWRCIRRVAEAPIKALTTPAARLTLYFARLPSRNCPPRASRESASSGLLLWQAERNHLPIFFRRHPLHCLFSEAARYEEFN